MAFNFNWSPLTADPTFYTRAQELLTSALNKSPKPPIIVDDILVSELNLGSIPPELEILEVGDLAEDRFRGIFKMRYGGNAFLTLKTRVQANPMNTYLSSRPSFASPEPLAAGSSLTIPIKITLSEIKLSAFIILVFSRAKGLTLVFRNDPLESLKVSSTFDSIPFVRDFLQRTIEQQLRNLLMEDVPAIIHRLSLRLFVPEYRAQEEALASIGLPKEVDEEAAADPFSSPPQDPVDINGTPLGSAEITALALEGHTDAPSVFSQGSLLGLLALTDSHRTLSPFTPSMKDVLFRVWAGRAEHLESAGFASPFTTSLSRRESEVDISSAAYTLPGAALETASLISRPSLVHSSTSFSRSSNVSLSKSGKPRKRKHRVINLRKNKSEASDLATIADESVFSEQASSITSDSASQADSAPASAPTLPTSYGTSGSKYGVDEVATPPDSPEQKRDRHDDQGKTPRRVGDLSSTEERDERTVRRPQPRRALFTDPSLEVRTSALERQVTQPTSPVDSSRGSQPSRPAGASRYFQSFPFPSERSASPFMTSSNRHSGSPPEANNQYFAQAQPSHVPAVFPYGDSAAPGGILEQAWMMKMAGEIAKRMHEQQEEERRRKSTRGPTQSQQRAEDIRDEGLTAPPPPYAA